jgi:hypothetical protein
MSRRSIIVGSARILRAGDSESFRESRTSPKRSSTIGSAANKRCSDPSSSPQNSATSTLQACAPQLL